MAHSLKERVKNALPPALFYMLRGMVQKKDLLLGFLYDLKRYWRWSPLGGKPVTPSQLGATITMDYHRIEKGLSLPAPRAGFGVDVIKRLAFNIPRYAKIDGVDPLPLRASYGALKQWVAHAKGTAPSVEKLAQDTVDFLEERYGNTNQSGGAITLDRQSILDKQAAPFEEFFNARFSVREFTDEKVSVDLLKKVLEITRKTPSVCNRQSWRVHAFLEPDTCRKVLSVQNGNRGFGENVPAVLVITSDLQSFLSAGERYQSWIDGGMFAMALALALHAQGLASCCLNWSVSPKADKKLRKLAPIADHENIIMMMAVGHMKETFPVATSPRIDVDTILASVN